MLRLLLPLILTACTTSHSSDDTGLATDDTSADNEPACATLSSGDDWAWKGACPQMGTPCDIVVNECSITIDYTADGGMTMGMPYAATIVGDTITFQDGQSVVGCVGTIEDADHVTGTCDGGCTFTLSR